MSDNIGNDKIFSGDPLKKLRESVESVNIELGQTQEQLTEIGVIATKIGSGFDFTKSKDLKTLNDGFEKVIKSAETFTKVNIERGKTQQILEKRLLQIEKRKEKVGLQAIKDLQKQGKAQDLQTKKVEEATKALKKFEDVNNLTNLSIDELTKATKQAKIEVNKLTTASGEQTQEQKVALTTFAKLNSTLVKTRKKLADATAEERDLERVTGQLDDSYIAWGAAIRRAEKELRSMNAEQAKGSKRGIELQKTITGNRNKQNEFNESLGNFRGNVGNYNGAISEMRSGLGGLASGLGGAAGGLGDLVSAAGPAGIALAAITAVISAIGAGVTLIKETNTELKKTEQLFGLVGDQAGNVRNRVSALANTFDKEFTEVLVSANNLSQQLEISQSEAFDLIEQGFIKGADANGEFLDSIKEYGVQFKNAGFEAEDFIKIATQNVKGGIFSDKLLDAVKEGSLSLKELTTSTTGAIEGAFGKKFTDDFVGRLNNGTLSVKDAFSELNTQVENTTLSEQQLGELTANVFRGAGEDAGGFEEVLRQVNVGLNASSDAVTKLEIEQGKLLESNQDLAKAQTDFTQRTGISNESVSILWSNIKTNLIEGTGALIEFSNSLDSGVIKGFEKAGTFINKEINGIITDIKSMDQSFLASIGIGDSLTDTLKNTADGIRKYVGEIPTAEDRQKRWNKVTEAAEVVSGKFTKALNLTGDAFGRVGKLFKDSSFGKHVADVFSPVIDGIAKVFSDREINLIFSRARNTLKEGTSKTITDINNEISALEEIKLTADEGQLIIVNDLLEGLRVELEKKNKLTKKGIKIDEVAANTIAGVRIQISKQKEALEKLNKTDAEGIKKKQGKIKKLEEELQAILAITEATKELTNIELASLDQKRTVAEVDLENSEAKKEALELLNEELKNGTTKSQEEVRDELKDIEDEKLVNTRDRLNQELGLLEGAGKKEQETEEEFDTRILNKKKELADAEIAILEDKNAKLAEANTKANEKELKDDAELAAKQRELVDFAFDQSEKTLQAFFDGRQDKIGRDIENSETRLEELKGVENRFTQEAGDNRAFEEKRIAEGELNRERSIRRQRRIEGSLAGIKLISANLDEGDTPAVALKDTLSQAGQAVSSFLQFKEGTEHVGEGNAVRFTNKGDDAFLARVDKGERIIKTTLNDKLPRSMTNEHLVNLGIREASRGPNVVQQVAPSSVIGEVARLIEGADKEVNVNFTIEWNDIIGGITTTMENQGKINVEHQELGGTLG